MLIKFFAVILLFGAGFFIQTGMTRPSGVMAGPASAAPTPDIPGIIVPRRNDSPVKQFGSFQKVKTDGEHASGYSVDLWKENGKLIGLIAVHRGLIGDPPTGLIENVQFDPQTKKFSFTAKLTIGQFYDKTHEDVPSQDILKFDGTLTNKKLAGTVKMTNQLCPDKCPESMKISLPVSKDRDFMTQNFQTHDEWQAYIDKILEFRGPNW
jgi:hypothetical protein